VKKLDTLFTAASALALSLPAWANPPRDPPPQVMRPDIQLHNSTDGRGDMHEAAARNMEPPAAVKPAPESLSHRDMQLPIKSEVAMKARPGDDKDNATGQQVVKANPQSQPAARDDRMGRPDAPPPVQIKTQVMLKLQGDESPEGGKVSTQLPTGAAKGTGEQKALKPHSRQELESFSKHTGLKLPFDPEGSDDADDKVE
jgi:hypothetical protein